jgi:hypothetical protein
MKDSFSGGRGDLIAEIPVEFKNGELAAEILHKQGSIAQCKVEEEIRREKELKFKKRVEEKKKLLFGS